MIRRPASLSYCSTTISEYSRKNLPKPLPLPKYKGLNEINKPSQPQPLRGVRKLYKTIQHCAESRAYLTGDCTMVSGISPLTINPEYLDRMCNMLGLTLMAVDDMAEIPPKDYDRYMYDYILTDIIHPEPTTTFTELELDLRSKGTRNFLDGYIHYKTREWDKQTKLHREQLQKTRLTLEPLPIQYAWYFLNEFFPLEGINIWWRIAGVPIPVMLMGLEDAYMEAITYQHIPADFFIPESEIRIGSSKLMLDAAAPNVMGYGEV